MFWIEVRGMNRALEVEGEPFLDATHSRLASQVEEEHEVEDDGCGQDAVPAKTRS